MEPPVDQKLLEDFLSLCRHRSFSHAAQERNVTQPAFSRRIRALEEWLGVVLFDRTALPVRLTAQGEQFLPVARDIVDRMAEARREFAAGNRSDGIVRLISLPTLSINVLPDLLFRVRQTCICSSRPRPRRIKASGMRHPVKVAGRSTFSSASSSGKSWKS